ncbi:MAG: PTS sugar transporter subunit IIA [Thermodesulfobacteriota bacterium]|nr:PTS sugar transporter subunit IIA [Thermodesulfobacteriota bacterium]
MKLTISEIAQRLDLNSETLERWIRQGRLPVNKQGNRGVFNESELKKWAEKQRLVYKNIDFEKKEGGSSTSVLLSSAIKSGGCFKGVEGIEKEDVIRSGVDLVPQLSDKSADELYQQIIAREKLTSTGIGKGVAIPHPRNPLDKIFTKPMIVTCFLENEIEFDSIDGMPVFVLFLLLSPSMDKHLNMLSKLSFCLRDNSFVQFLKTSPDLDSFLKKVGYMEEHLEKGGI